MERRMSSMTQMEIAKVIAARKPVILPTGATEAHGPHMPTDTDTHQVEHIALELSARIDAVVAPPVAYGISKTFEFFPGTISLSIPTYQTMVFEIGAALIRQGFHHLIILNGNRPNGTANDAVARHLVDELDRNFDFVVSAVSYWEPAADRIHAMRKSVAGGMGHGCELETSFQLATRPQLVKWPSLPLQSTDPSAGIWWLLPIRPALTCAVRGRRLAMPPFSVIQPRPPRNPARRSSPRRSMLWRKPSKIFRGPIRNAAELSAQVFTLDRAASRGPSMPDAPRAGGAPAACRGVGRSGSASCAQ